MSNVLKFDLASMGDIQLSEHFQLHEFQSNHNGEDRTDEILVDMDLVSLLEEIHNVYNGPIIVTSGYRTDSVSVAVGGSAGDPHTQGKAADIIVYDENRNIIESKYICAIAQDLGINGIGHMGNATHLDLCDRHWWGDEIAHCNVNNFYDYFGLSKSQVYGYEEVPPECQEPEQRQDVSIEDIAREVISGQWGNGQERRDRLESAGYDYANVQNMVDIIINGASEPQTPILDVENAARAVIRGEYGNGQERRDRLESEGYNYDEVQNRVNELLA